MSLTGSLFSNYSESRVVRIRRKRYSTMSSEPAGAAVQIVAMAIFISVILLFLGLGLLILIHVWIVGRVFRRGFGNNGSMVVMVSSSAACGTASMSKDELEKLPSYDYVPDFGMGSCSPVDCAVCLDNFKMGEKCRLLPLCKHSFHAVCVDAWLMKTPICPICRTSTADAGKGGLVTDSGVGLRESQPTGGRNLSDIRIE